MNKNIALKTYLKKPKVRINEAKQKRDNEKKQTKILITALIK